MITIEQIEQAHSKVKSGADFPRYIQEIKTLGIVAFVHYVSDGHIEYFTQLDSNISERAKWAPIEIAEVGSEEKLNHALTIHQEGKSDYPTFCKQSAEAGVEKWVVDMEKMICTYYDKAGKALVSENIPTL